MMKRILMIFSAILFALFAQAQKTYDIRCGGLGVNGDYLVRVTVYVPNAKNSPDVLKRCAVHGVLFRGFMGDDVGSNDQKPLVLSPDLEDTRGDVFKEFFGNGDYNRYVSLETATITSKKIKSRRYEVSALLLVNKDGLIKWLESKGIRNGFNDLW